MYTVVLMAAITSGHAATGQWRAGNPCRGCWGCYGGYPGSGYNYMVANGYQSAFSVYAPVSGYAAGSGSGAGVFGCAGCYGCYGGWSCYGVPLPGHGYWSQQPGGAGVPDKAKSKVEETPPPTEQLPIPKQKTSADGQVRARLTIDVPEGAKVFLDGELMNLAAGKRDFQTPDLQPGLTYYYDLRVEIVRDGQTIAENQRIILRPGQTVTAAFPNLNQDPGVVPVTNGQK
jgi:uncharacterized protein (TIGR03000 family)